MTTLQTAQRSFDNLRYNWRLAVVMAVESVATSLLVLFPALPLIPKILEGPIEPSVIVGIIEGWLDDLLERPVLILGIAAILLIIVTIAAVIHIFIVGGTAKILHDWEASSAESRTSSDRTLVRMFSQARQIFFPAFLLYNITWGVGLIACLVPALPIIAFLSLEEDPTRLAVGGIVGLILWVIFLIVAGLMIRAVTAVALGRLCHDPENVAGAVRSAVATVVRHPAPFVKITLLMILVSVAAGAISGGLEVGLGFSGGFATALLLIELIKWTIGSALSAVAGVWFLAALIGFEHQFGIQTDTDGKAFATGDNDG